MTILKGQNNVGEWFFFFNKNINIIKRSFFSILGEMSSLNIDLYKEQSDTGKFIKNENVTYSRIISENNFIFKSKKYNPKLFMTQQAVKLIIALSFTRKIIPE